MPVFIFHSSGAEHCSFIFCFHKKKTTHQNRFLEKFADQKEPNEKSKNTNVSRRTLSPSLSNSPGTVYPVTSTV